MFRLLIQGHPIQHCSACFLRMISWDTSWIPYIKALNQAKTGRAVLSIFGETLELEYAHSSDPDYMKRHAAEDRENDAGLALDRLIELGDRQAIRVLLASWEIM